MPAAAIFLAGGGVLSADHRRTADLPARDAYVAADADADVVVAAFLDLLRQPGIGNRRTGGADDVGDALGDDLRHFFRIGEAADAEHRLLRHLLDEARPGHLMALLVEARGARILAPFGDVADVDVPQIDQRIGQRDEFHAVVLRLRRPPRHTACRRRSGWRSRSRGRPRRRTFSSVSSQKRARFSSEPPYLSLRLL